jgi:hypothetical protein
VDGNKQENDTQERGTRSTSDENTVRTCSWKAWLSIPREREGAGEKAAADEGIRGRKENSKTKIYQNRRWRWSV